MIRYLLLVLPFLIIAGCEKDEKKTITPNNPASKTEFLFINNGETTINSIDFNIRIYFPKENFTKFVNKIKELGAGDTIKIQITDTPYSGCHYQYMIYYNEKNNSDSLINFQYLSTTDTLKQTTHLFVIDWPKDSIRFKKIN